MLCYSNGTDKNVNTTHAATWPLLQQQQAAAGGHISSGTVDTCRVSRNEIGDRPFESLPWASCVTKKGDVILSADERRALLKLL